VWFDQSELRGGDAWDRSIREKINECALFIPVISASAHARVEGYFRLEWKLAVDRSHRMAPDQAFLLPVAIDDTSQADKRIPDRFRELHWTRLPGGETPPAFIERIQRLLVPNEPARPAAAASIPSGSTVARASIPSPHPTRASNIVLWTVSALLATGLAYLITERLWRPQHSQATPAAEKTDTSTSANPQPEASFNPPPHSIAVLPFVNMSGDKEQEYFSEGLTEELLNTLSRINELQVAARTSSFSFAGEHPDIATVAHKLNVGAVLEGSVRRSAHTIRVTTQLVNGVTGFHVWSQTYDRDLGDVLQLQSDIATAVASALRVTLLGDEAAKIEVGGTRNPAAIDAYLKATKAYADHVNRSDVEDSIANYTKAIELDPNYAVAYVGRSIAFGELALNFATSREVRATVDKAEADARKAIALTPNLGLAHLALASAFETALDFGRASDEYERSNALEPGNARILKYYGFFAVCMGRLDAGLAALRRAVTLDPLNVDAYSDLGLGLILSRRYKEALEVLRREGTLNPRDPTLAANIGIAEYLLGDYEEALKSCEKRGDDYDAQFCLAITYDKVGRHSDAQGMLDKMSASRGDAGAVFHPWVLAQWGQADRALDALEAAARVRAPYLEQLKTAALFDPLRNEPRFQAIERALRFPD
jgi:TolB-like protein/Tfp pilus assembly protein PilF